MLILELILLFLSLFSLYFYFSLKKLFKNQGNQDKKMQEEAKRVLFNDAKNIYPLGGYPLQDRTHCTGLALIKDEKTGKYNLVPQIKVCDTGLC